VKKVEEFEAYSKNVYVPLSYTLIKKKFIADKSTCSTSLYY